MNIFLFSDGEIIIDNKMDLLNIDTSSKQISGDKDSGASSSEFFHNQISLSLFHISMHRRDNEILFLQSLG